MSDYEFKKDITPWGKEVAALELENGLVLWLRAELTDLDVELKDYERLAINDFGNQDAVDLVNAKAYNEAIIDIRDQGTGGTSSTRVSRVTAYRNDKNDLQGLYLHNVQK